MILSDICIVIKYWDNEVINSRKFMKNKLSPYTCVIKEIFIPQVFQDMGHRVLELRMILKITYFCPLILHVRIGTQRS